MGDAARRRQVTTHEASPEQTETRKRWPERPTPRKPPAGYVRVRGIVATRSGYVVRTYDVPEGVIDECLSHERPPDTLHTATGNIGTDLWLEFQ